jgi:hypothetical protein
MMLRLTASKCSLMINYSDVPTLRRALSCLCHLVNDPKNTRRRRSALLLNRTHSTLRYLCSACFPYSGRALNLVEVRTDQRVEKGNIKYTDPTHIIHKERRLPL